MKDKLVAMREFFTMLSELDNKKKKLFIKWVEDDYRFDLEDLENVIGDSEVLEDIKVIPEIKVHPIPGGGYGAIVVYEEMQAQGGGRPDKVVRSVDNFNRYDGDCIGGAVSKALAENYGNCILTEDFYIKEI